MSHWQYLLQQKTGRLCMQPVDQLTNKQRHSDEAKNITSRPLPARLHSIA